MSCPCLPGCVLPSLICNDIALQRWQDEYCSPPEAYRDCERWKAAQSGRRFPPGMFPNGFVPGREP